MSACTWRHHHPPPHGKGYRRKGYLPVLCRNCWSAALGTDTTDRYQVVSLTGYPIPSDPFANGAGDATARTDWYIQDRVLNYKVVRTFTAGGNRTIRFTRIQAQLDALEECARMNRDERRWMRAGAA